MKNKRIFSAASAAMVCMMLFFACKKNDSSEPVTTPFDQKQLLANYADNLIVPAYTTLADASDKLAEASETFSAETNESNLAALQAQFKTTYKAWIHCEPYDFGPADDLVMLQSAIAFTANPDQINAELASSAALTESYISTLGAQKKGLAALAYLLFSLNMDNSAILEQFVSSENAERRKNYVTALAADISQNIHRVLDAWNNGYSTTFKTNTGTQLNTSLSLLLNHLVVALETTKNVRLGIPIGRKDNFSEEPVNPSAVELPTTGFAKEMLAESASTLADLFQGKSSQGNGQGFDDYLASLDVEEGNTTLENAINTELDTFKNDIAAIAAPMQTTISNDPSTVYNSWVQSKKLLVFFKVDLPSNLGILITFSDNDGD